ncbi:hypothetical protein JTM19_08105 [Pseudomonas aeruginosa]|nr:hypothetical protein [Pseudomonas aeruginosa]
MNEMSQDTFGIIMLTGLLLVCVRDGSLGGLAEDQKLPQTTALQALTPALVA